MSNPNTYIEIQPRLSLPMWLWALFSIVSQQNQRIYHITPANQATTLPNIHHDQETLREIQAALNSGKEVTTHTDSISVPGWTGAGYIIIDPITGDGVYKISGGSDGGG